MHCAAPNTIYPPLNRDTEAEHYVEAIKGTLTFEQRQGLAGKMWLKIDDWPDDLFFCEVELVDSIDSLPDVKAIVSDGYVSASREDDDEETLQ
jgi:hypothetical protein